MAQNGVQWCMLRFHKNHGLTIPVHRSLGFTSSGHFYLSLCCWYSGYFSSQNRPHRLWGPPSAYRDYFVGVKAHTNQCADI